MTAFDGTFLDLSELTYIGNAQQYTVKDKEGVHWGFDIILDGVKLTYIYESEEETNENRKAIFTLKHL